MTLLEGFKDSYITKFESSGTGVIPLSGYDKIWSHENSDDNCGIETCELL